MPNVHNITPLGFVRAAFLFKASQLAALFCCQRVGGSAIPVLPGCYPYTCRAVQSLMDAPRGSHKVLYNRHFPLKPSKSLYNRFYAAIVSLYYRTTKHRLQPHRVPYSAHAKITRLASRQDGHYYWSTPGHCKHRAPFPAFIIPRAASLGALNVAQRAEFESQIVDSRNASHSRLIVDSRLIVVRHSRSVLHNATLDAIFELFGISYITQRIVWREHNLRFIYKSVVVLLPPHQSYGVELSISS